MSKGIWVNVQQDEDKSITEMSVDLDIEDTNPDIYNLRFRLVSMGLSSSEITVMVDRESLLLFKKDLNELIDSELERRN